MASSKRITKELSDLNKEPLDGITIETNEENIYKWTAKLKGPTGSPYEKGTFNLLLEFPIEYPFKSPKTRFITPIYHPNIDNDGNLCVGVLKAEGWKPSTKASTVLLAIQQLLAEPNPDDALVASIGEVYTSNRAQFNKLAAEHTEKHARG